VSFGNFKMLLVEGVWMLKGLWWVPVTSVVVEEKDRKGNESLVDGSWSHGIDVSNMSYIPMSVMWQGLGM
jgi:hypothetical protein